MTSYYAALSVLVREKQTIIDTLTQQKIEKEKLFQGGMTEQNLKPLDFWEGGCYQKPVIGVMSSHFNQKKRDKSKI